MKALLFIPILLCFLRIDLYAQEQEFLLRPEFGKEYIYEYTESKYLKGKGDERLREFIRQKNLKITYNKSGPEGKELLNVKVIKNWAGKLTHNPSQVVDYRFPDFKDGYYGRRYDNYYEELLCDILFKFEFNEGTNEVGLYNRDEVLLAIRERLHRKEFDQKGMEKYTTEFIEKGIPQITNYLNALYKVDLRFDRKLDSSKSKMELNKEKARLEINQTAFDTLSGLISRNFIANPEERFLINYTTIHLDTASRHNLWVNERYYKYIQREKCIRLIQRKDIKQNRLVVSGTIEKLKNRKVVLYVLRKPFGTFLQEESVHIDNNGSFHIDTDLYHKGLAFLQFGQKNRAEKVFTIPLYVEPGDNIGITIKKSDEERSVEFSGDHAIASQMIYECHRKFNLFAETDLSLIRHYFPRLELKDLSIAIKSYEDFIKAYSSNIDPDIFKYLSNEIKAQLLAVAYNYLQMFEVNRKLAHGRMSFRGKDELDEELLRSFVDSCSIHGVYNDFGVYSRVLAKQLVDYQFDKVRKVENVGFPSFSTTVSIAGGAFQFYGDLPYKIEFTKTVLNGSALYCYLAEILNWEKTRIANQPDKSYAYLQNTTDAYLDLMMRLSNNFEFYEAIQQIANNHSRWLEEKYVPDTKFFNDRGTAQYFKDFLGKKPTVFYITQRWGQQRYHFDDLAKENPDINFVMLMEGSNITEWMDYIERAEPVANQLFHINQEIQFQDIFKKSGGHFIVYNSDGVRFGFAGNMVTAKNYAKQSLSESKKKGLNKSQLLIIILTLSIILTTLIIGLLIWKWRVRQRLKREKQFRKLRELELTAIRSQMNPHFLFNSLNSVQNLIQQNKGREAHLYLSDFAGLIRKVLRNSEKEEVSLAEELEMTKQYLSLEKLRFDFDFSINTEKGIDLQNTMVPSLLLQPFAENAIIHGLQNKSNNRRLTIEVKKSNTGICILMEDNGIGREQAKRNAKARNGIGSKLVEERLKILREKHQENYELVIDDICSGEKRGTRVEINVPDEK